MRLGVALNYEFSKSLMRFILRGRREREVQSGGC